MARLSIQERIFLIESMAEMKSRIETWRRFKKKFGHQVNMKTIDRTVKKWKEVGSVQDQMKGKVGLAKSARTPENREKINEKKRVCILSKYKSSSFK